MVFSIISLQVLDLSFNRIKKLKRSSFQPYKSVKYLLLYENMIQSVEPGTFSHLTSLQVIDIKRKINKNKTITVNFNIHINLYNIFL